MGQSIGCHRLRHSGNHEQVTAFGHFLEVSDGRIRLRVHHDVLKVAVTGGDGGLLFVHDRKWQAMTLSALAPCDRGPDGVAIHQEGGGEALEKSG
jgi:hypothetical protein